jgi:hypothetical protein
VNNHATSKRSRFIPLFQAATKSWGLGLERGDVLRVDHFVVGRGDGVLPDELLGGDLRSEIAPAGPMSRWVSLNHARAKTATRSENMGTLARAARARLRVAESHDLQAILTPYPP